MAEGVESVSVWARRERQRVRVWAVRVSAQVVGGGAVPSYVPVRALIKPVLEPCPANAAKLLSPRRMPRRNLRKLVTSLEMR